MFSIQRLFVPEKYGYLIKSLMLLFVCFMSVLIIYPFWRDYVFVIHTLLELLCIMIAFSAFITAWINFYKNSIEDNVIGFGFLVVTVFDILHTFFYQTTIFEYFYSQEILLKFWLLGRYAEVTVLLLVALNFSGFRLNRFKIMAVTLAFIVGPICLVFTCPFALRLWTEKGMTHLKIVLEYFIILLLAAVFIILLRNKGSKISEKFNYDFLLTAIILSIIAEFNFTMYKDNITAFYTAFGHALRVICYACLFRGIFIKIAEDPYRKIENALSLSENLFQTAFENAPEGIALLSVDGSWIRINKALCSILGYSEGDLLRTNCRDLLFTGDPDIYDNIVDKLMDGSYPAYNGEISYCTGPGDVLWLAINNSLVRDSSGNTSYLILQVEDITGRKKAADLEMQALKSEMLLKETIELEHLRTEFFANLSHEFRTPLNVILGMLQLIDLYLNKDGAIDTENMRNKMKTVKQNCFRMLRLINNLIDITKIDAGFFSLNLKNHDIINVVEEITLSVAEYIRNKGIALVFDTDCEEKVIACDADKIERIMLNLISNSIKFTDNGGVITVNIRDLSDTIEIEISDTGVGIPEDKLGIIFERFRQADGYSDRNKEGSGIGLSLVKSLVEMHGGTVSAESKYMEGCKIKILLPSRKLEEEDGEQEAKTIKIQSSHIERINVEFSDIYLN